MTKVSKRTGRNFYHNVLLISITATLIISTIIGYTVYSTLNRSVEQTVKKIETANAQIISQNFDNSLNTVCSIAGYLTTLNSLPIDYMEMTAKQWVKAAINSTINSYMLNYSYISSIYTEIGNTAFSSGIQHNGDYAYLTEYNGFKISICQDNTWPHILQFESIESNYSINKTIIQIESEKLADSIFTYDGSDRFEYITDTNGTIIISNNSNSVFKDLFEFCNISLKNEDLLFSSESISGKESYVTAVRISNSVPFIYTTSINSDFYFSLTKNALVRSVTICVSLTVLSVLLVYMIVTFTYKPIREISETFKHYYPDLEMHEDEITFITSQIQNTIKEKRNLEQRLPETVKRLNRSQIAALQSQINPHFLFNTLENIKGISVSNYGINNDIEKSLILLDAILYESINQKNILSSIQGEINITKTYIELMWLRYGSIFTVEWSVSSDSLYNAKIIRFTIQPIIENCFLKGFNRKRTDNKIYISFVELNGTIEISITDNGKGIEPELLKKIKSDLSDFENNESNHVGLKNVNLRIKLLFGDDYGISNIKSDCNGTTVKIRIPIIIDDKIV